MLIENTCVTKSYVCVTFIMPNCDIYYDDIQIYPNINMYE